METNIHYCRSSYQEGTVAVEIPSKENLTAMLMNHVSRVRLKVGMAVLHPKENFVKKVGRELATSRMKDTFLLLESVAFAGENSEFLHWEFVTEELIKMSNGDDYGIQFVVTTHKDKPYSRLVQADIQ